MKNHDRFVHPIENQGKMVKRPTITSPKMTQANNSK